MYPTSAVSTAPKAGFSGILCCACKKPVSQPCWYCVQCAGSTFICWECDGKNSEEAVAFGEHDFHTHDLVKVQELVEDRDFSVEERLGELEERFGRMEQLLEQLLSRLAQGTA
jgi:predicted amidophosphoribosyltransferase